MENEVINWWSDSPFPCFSHFPFFALLFSSSQITIRQRIISVMKYRKMQMKSLKCCLVNKNIILSIFAFSLFHSLFSLFFLFCIFVSQRRNSRRILKSQIRKWKMQLLLVACLFCKFPYFPVFHSLFPFVSPLFPFLHFCFESSQNCSWTKYNFKKVQCRNEKCNR